MNKSESIVKLAEALALAQAEMPAVKFNSVNPFLKNKYADLGAIIETSQPILAKFGLAVSQFTFSEGDKVGIETMLMHKSGEWLSTAISMATADEKGKSNAQVAGSIVTYLRRYSLAAILNMYADEDGDGNKVKLEKHDWQAVQAEAAKVETPAPANPNLGADWMIAQQEGKPKQVTLEDALKHLNSQNVPYGDLESNTLKIMWNAMAKSITKNHLEGEKKAELEYKMRLCKMITDAREAGEITDK